VQTFGYGFDALNRQTSMTDPTGTTNWTYDANSQTTQVASPAGTIGYGYDAAGARTSMTLPGSRTVTYGYDPSGNLTSLTDWQSQQTTFGYDAAGQQTSITRPNGVATNTTYDAAGQITGIEHHTAGSTLQSFSYAYDDAGNRISVLTAAGTESYTFDLLNRLTEVDYPNGDVVTYTYDANGNRLTQTVNGTTRTSTYDAADQHTTLDGTSYSYDANGNLTAAGTDSFSWDWNNQLSSATVNGTTTGYTYDGTGNRVSATTGGTTTPDLWDNSSGLPSLVSDGTNTYLQANGVQSATDASNTTSYALTDALGSVRGLTDASGTLTGTTAYDAFGAVRAQSGSSLALGFTGALTDPTTGFLDLRARDLAPALGRFLSADTVSPNAPGSQGYNLYAYVANNPTTWTDPSGQSISGAVSETWLLLQAAFHIDYYVEPIVEGIALIAYGSPLQKIGGATDLIFTAVACALDTPCRDLATGFGRVVNWYGSTTHSGTWTLGARATRLAIQHFPTIPTSVLCTVAAVGAGYETARGNPAYVGVGASDSGGIGPGGGVGCSPGGSGGGSNGLNIYRGKTSAPQWPKGFTPARGQTIKDPVTNRELLSQLRSQMPGQWQKVYENGWIDGQQVSVHYFQHESGAVFNVKVVSGWSTR